MNPESAPNPQQGPAQPIPNPGQVPPGQLMPSPYSPMTDAHSKKKHSMGLIISLIIFVTGFIASSGFAAWAFASMQDYKNNVDEKVASAVGIAVGKTEDAKDKEFAEKEKSPYKKYKGPATFGTIEITYPKTWSGFIDEQGGTSVVNGYFHPDYVPGLKSNTAFALRLEVIEQPYDRVLGGYDGSAKKGTVKVSPYKAPKVPSVLGARVDGAIEKDMQGSAILLPLRDKTIRISTLSGQSFGKDFDEIILPNLMFTP